MRSGDIALNFHRDGAFQADGTAVDRILFKLNFNGVEFNAFIVRIVDAQNGIAVFPNGFERKITHLRIGVRTQKARCEKTVMPEVKCGVEYALRALESAKRQQKRSE